MLGTIGAVSLMKERTAATCLLRSRFVSSSMNDTPPLITASVQLPKTNMLRKGLKGQGGHVYAERCVELRITSD